MMYVIKQQRADGAAYWNGREYVKDMDAEAKFYTDEKFAHDDLADMGKADRHNALVVAVKE